MTQRMNALNVKKEIVAIVFDLGRVLIKLDGPPLKSHWLAQPVSEEESWRRWGRSETVRAFESGLMSDTEFLQTIITEQKLIISADQFREQFAMWPYCLYDGVESTLLKLRERFVLAYYSNTSSLHQPQINRLLPEHYFDFYFTSYQTGYFKPNIQGFYHVAEQMRQKPESILFLDDNSMNVQSARDAGFCAEQVVGFDEAYKQLGVYGCL